MELNDEVKKYLLELEDKKYLEFSKKLNAQIENYKQIGVRIPLIRNYAKELGRNYKLDYLIDNIDEEYYEELEKNISIFVPKIYDWAICDSFSMSLKITKKYKKEIWKLINKYLKSNKEFEVRFALVMILNYYIDDEHIEEIYKIINKVSVDKYYVKMANAWLISYCVIKYYERTYKYLKEECTIDNWTYNKGIQKSIESYRITNEQKQKLKELKKK